MRRLRTKGIAMSFHIRSVASAIRRKSLAERSAFLNPDWNERMVSLIAVGCGVAIVATIAGLMGMA